MILTASQIIVIKLRKMRSKTGNVFFSSFFNRNGPFPLSNVRLLLLGEKTPREQIEATNLGKNLWMRVKKRDGPQQRRSGRVLSREQEVEEVAADLPVPRVRRRSRFPRLPRRADLPRRLLHPEVDQAARFLPPFHPLLALPRAARQRLHKPVHGEPRLPEREPGQVEGQLHQPDVEQVVVHVEPLALFSAQVRPYHPVKVGINSITRRKTESGKKESYAALAAAMSLSMSAAATYTRL